MDAVLLMLADSRLPAGGHAHSGGVETALSAGLLRGPADLAVFLRGRLRTAGLVAAGLAAAAARMAASSTPDWTLLDTEADARTPSPAQRQASRAQGRALVRAGRIAWPGPVWNGLPTAPHQPIAIGVAAASGGEDRGGGAALVAAYLSVSGPAAAAVRLRGWDPLAVQGILASLGDEIEAVARVGAADVPLRELPAAAAPRLDVLAELHARAEVRLFAS